MTRELCLLQRHLLKYVLCCSNYNIQTMEIGLRSSTSRGKVSNLYNGICFTSLKKSANSNLDGLSEKNPISSNPEPKK